MTSRPTIDTFPLRIKIARAAIEFLAHGEAASLWSRAIRKAFSKLGRCHGVVCFDGTCFRINLWDNRTEQHIYFHWQKHDFFERLFVMKAAESIPDFLFVDIGANVGLYTITVASAAHAAAKVVAIDANPEMIERLSENLSLNNSRCSVYRFSCAVADSDGVMEFVVNAANKGESTLLGSCETSKDSRGVDARRLESVLRAIDLEDRAIDVIKIDIEGGEHNALAGFLRRQANQLPGCIIIEGWGSIVEERIAWLASHGYALQHRTAMNLIFILPGNRMEALCGAAAGEFIA